MNKLFLTITLFCIKSTSSQNGCLINIFDLPDPQPIIMSLTFKILYPPIENDADDLTVQIGSGERLTISCVSSQFTSLNNTNSTTITCKGDNKFEDDDKNPVDFTKLQCHDEVKAVVQKSGNSCGEDAEIIDVGFPIKDFKFYYFLPLLSVCFDKYYRQSVFVNYQITKSIGFKQEQSNQKFIEDVEIYNFNYTLDELFAQENSVRTVNRLLGLPSDSSKYISSKFKEAFLADASRDFVYKYLSREATRYINVFPQWPNKNNNWDTLNSNIIKYIQSRGTDLEIYTGTYGTSKLPHEDTRRFSELYLYADDSLTVALPIPLLTWKVVYDKDAKRATAFLSVNPNPGIDSEDADLIISSTISWLEWEPLNRDLGYSYACSYHQLRQRVPELPKIELVGNLV